MTSKGLVASITFLFSLLLCMGTSAKSDNYTLYPSAKSGLFHYHKNKDLSQYDSVVLFPTKYQGVKISDETNPKYRKSWESFSESSWEELALEMDEVALNKFKNYKNYTLTKTPNQRTLGLEFSFLEFTPKSLNNSGDTGTTGGSTNTLGLGNMLFQIAVIDYETQELLIMVKSKIAVNPGMTTVDNKTTRKLMWKKTFQKLAGYFTNDLESIY